MSKGDAGNRQYGKEVWKKLERIMAKGHDRSRVFSDWLELMMAANLSATDNLTRPDFEKKLAENKLDGKYEERYLEIVKRYSEGPRGDRPIDLMAQAYGLVIKETQTYTEDVLGDIFVNCITFGEHGQFFTPSAIGLMMADIMGLEDGKTVVDPSCGSGNLLIQTSKRNRNVIFYGNDLDRRCSIMCALNMHFLGLNAFISEGNTLSGEYWTEWRIAGGAIYERDIKQLPKSEVVQASLFAA